MDTDSYSLLSQYIVAQKTTIMRVQVQKLVVGIILNFLENIKKLAVGGGCIFFFLPATLEDPQLRQAERYPWFLFDFWTLYIHFLLLWLKFHIDPELVLLKDVIYLQHDSSCWCTDGSRIVVLMGKYELQTWIHVLEAEIVKQWTNIALGEKKYTSQVLL